MDGATASKLAAAATLEALYRELAPLDLHAGWNKPTPALWAEPRRSFRPAQWRYDQAKGALDAAGRLINTELAERRNLILANPIDGNSYATARTMVVAYQMIMPGERARSHRHTPNALRLVLDAAPGAYTVVDGKKLPMLPGDVVLTPSWSWHGHGNEGGACAYWLDFLDVPLVQLLDPMFFEPHPAGFEEGESSADSAQLFSWSDTERRLAAAAGGDGAAVEIELGHPALATLALFMTRLAAGRSTVPQRTTANTAFAVVSGAGTTVVEGESYPWRRGDVVVVPSWHRYEHRADEASVLFRVTDEPVMERLGFLRSESAAAAPPAS